MQIRQHASSALVAIALMGSACSPSTQAAGPRIEPGGRPYRSVYLVTHSEDPRPGVAASIQANFQRRGYLVSSGPETEIPNDADLVVRYIADWSNGPSMYLRRVSILLYDARTQALLDSGSWKNSSPHRFDSADAVVAEIMEEIARKVGLSGDDSAPR